MKIDKINLCRTGLVLVSLAGATCLAAPVTYKIDPRHSYPSFEADHMGGLSTWRGKFNSTSGTIVYDGEAQSGTVEVTVDMASIDFGNEDLNAHAQSDELFDAAKYPTATYRGRLAGFKDGIPTEVDGTLEMRGITRPLKLKIDSFLCKPNPMDKKETCGADASGTLNREDFGVTYGKNLGFKMELKLEIQVEAIRAP